MSSARRWFPLMIFIAGVLANAWAQDSAATPKKSLAELAAEAKARKTASPKVDLDDDSFQGTKPAIPDVYSGAMDNSLDIIQAITDYRKTHSRHETEDLVHAWFDKHDAILAKAIEENRRIEERQADRQYLDGYRYNARNQREYQAEYEADIRSAREDYQTKKENGLLCARIQQTFSKVRSKLQSQGMVFDWFKIRCGNGNCSF